MNDNALIDYLRQLQDEIKGKAEEAMNNPDYLCYNRDSYCMGLDCAADILEDAIKDIEENP